MIGVFDSGLGGLSILKHFLKRLPEHDYIYLGDSARVPYGSKSGKVVFSYTCQAVDFLFAKGCKLVILACNTASARALRKIQQEYLPGKYPGRNILGVIRPLVEAVASDEKIKKVGVIGTKTTIESKAYEEELEKLNPEIKVFGQATPLLVPLVEEGWTGKRETKMILKKYLRPLKEKKVEALILGCTHYLFLIKEIKGIMGKNCKIYNPGEIVAESLKDYLERHREYEDGSGRGGIKFYTTDSMDKFRDSGEKFLGRKIDDVEKVEL
jgi:glutamate racemase